MPSRDVARDLRRLAEYMRRNQKLYENFGDVDDIKKSTRRSNEAKLTARDIKRAGTIDSLPMQDKAALIALGTFYLETTKALNKHLKVKTNLNRTKGDSELPRDSKGKRITKLTITYDSSKVMMIGRFPFKKLYRDPDKAEPYNFHWGASSKFRRYGITEVKIFGKRVKAGRKGSLLEGLGFEPMGTKPKASASFPKDYRVFRRVGYPGRRNPDTITIKDGNALLKVAVYTRFFRNPSLRGKVISNTNKVVSNFMQDSGNILVVRLSKIAKEI